jgi:uncharacterized protein
MSAFMQVCGCLLLRSLLGVKRTCLFALHMSAFDPKRTCIGTCAAPKQVSKPDHSVSALVQYTCLKNRLALVMTIDFSGARSDAFGYVCRRCSRCCYDKRIQVNPYEIARLARSQSQSTSEFSAASTIDGLGTELRRKEDGSCVFLVPGGCQVHDDRPLVCRLYPLGRRIHVDGSESYTTVEGHPQSKGEFTNKSTIAEYISEQEAGPFIDAADGYFRWICSARSQLGPEADPYILRTTPKAIHIELLDMDSSVATYCSANGLSEPTDLEDRRQLHLQLLYEALVNTGGQHDETGQENRDEFA